MRWGRWGAGPEGGGVSAEGSSEGARGRFLLGGGWFGCCSCPAAGGCDAVGWSAAARGAVMAGFLLCTSAPRQLIPPLSEGAQRGIPDLRTAEGKAPRMAVCRCAKQVPAFRGEIPCRGVLCDSSSSSSHLPGICGVMRSREMMVREAFGQCVERWEKRETTDRAVLWLSEWHSSHQVEMRGWTIAVVVVAVM